MRKESKRETGRLDLIEAGFAIWMVSALAVSFIGVYNLFKAIVNIVSK